MKMSTSPKGSCRHSLSTAFTASSTGVGSPSESQERIRRQVADFHRVHASGHLDDRRLIKGLGEFVRVDGGGGDDQFQVASLPEQGFDDSQDKINVQASLVGFIHDEGVVAIQKGVVAGFRPAGCHRS